MSQYSLAKVVESVTIRSADDIFSASLALQGIASSRRLLVAPWHDLAAGAPIVDESGGILCSSVFGWGEENWWWRALAAYKICPLAELCRYTSEPFWCNSNSTFSSTVPFLVERWNSIDLSWLWDNGTTRSVLVVPVHMQMSKVGFVAYLSADENYDYWSELSDLSIISRAYVTSYMHMRTKPRADGDYYEQLTQREIECLTWALDGKTDKDIAVLMNRSYATIRTYLVSVADKLGTVNRAQTLARAVSLGYVADRSAAFSH